MRFADQRAEAAAAAQPEVEPDTWQRDTWQPTHTRTSRRRLGLRRSSGRGSMLRRERNARRQPPPWKPAPTIEGNE